MADTKIAQIIMDGTQIKPDEGLPITDIRDQHQASSIPEVKGSNEGPTKAINEAVEVQINQQKSESDPQVIQEIVNNHKDSLQREYEVPSQRQFSDNVHDVVLAPAYKELHNGHLASFLKRHNDQEGLGEEKIGVVILLNNLPKEGAESNLDPENALTARYLEMLQKRDPAGIDSLSLPNEYKELAKTIIDENKLEVRFDYVIDTVDSVPHFGLLRSHLFDVIQQFKSAEIPDDDIIAHLTDIDGGLSPTHFLTLQKYYDAHEHKANISEWDFIPGMVEEGNDISQQVLKTLDDYRLFRYAENLRTILSGNYASGTPTISGRLSFFKETHAANLLTKFTSNEDFALSKVMLQQLENKLGHVGEVYFLDRARESDTGARTDSQYRYQLTAGEGLVFQSEEIDPALRALLVTLDDEANNGEYVELPTLHGCINDILELTRGDSAKQEMLYNMSIRRSPPESTVKNLFKDEIAQIDNALKKDFPEFHELLSTTSTKLRNELYLRVIEGLVVEYENQQPDYQTEKENFNEMYTRFFILEANSLKKVYKSPNDVSEYINSTLSNRIMNSENGHTPENDEQFQNVLNEEMALESAKVRLRRLRLFRTIQALRGEGELSKADHAMTAPYEKYFQEELQGIVDSARQGESLDQILDRVINNYSTFFTVDETHASIAKLRALKRYALDHYEATHVGK